MAVNLREEEEALDRSLQSLAHILFAGHTAEATLEAVANLAQQSIPGCDAASVTVIENGRPRTSVSTAAVAEAIDHHQYQGDAGPCLDAVRTRAVIRVDSYDAESRWPNFVPEVLKQGVHSSLSLPLAPLEEPVGALNLYSHAQAGFAGSQAVGEVFANQAAITMANGVAFHRAVDLARNLALALEHRDVIGQAKGILMASDGVSPDEAFEILRRASQRANRKVYDLAADIVARTTAGRPEA